jgi:transcriptional regulator with XRE-family HTH domain
MPEPSPGDVLRTERLRRRLTLAEAGKLLGYSGSGLSRVENGRAVDVGTLRRLADCYGIPPQRLGLVTVGPTDALDGGDDVLRRELLAGVLGVAGATLVGLPRADADPVAPEAVTIDGLRRLVDRAQADYLACRYTQLAKGLPKVIRYAQATRTAVDVDQVGHVDALLPPPTGTPPGWPCDCARTASQPACPTTPSRPPERPETCWSKRKPRRWAR